MPGRLQAVLDESALARLEELLAAAEFVDGRSTAGFRARRVKQNLQMRKEGDHGREVNRLVVEALEKHPEFRREALPRRVHRPLISRYTPGMHYGSHVDDALMDAPNTLRTDLAVTIFLSDPDGYDGGELVVETALGEQQVKLPRGDAVLYPASTLHRVAPVLRGERLAAVTWVQSHVRDPARREILADLDLARRALQEKDPAARETDLLFRSYANLLRLWAEP